VRTKIGFVIAKAVRRREAREMKTKNKYEKSVRPIIITSVLILFFLLASDSLSKIEAKANPSLSLRAYKDYGYAAFGDINGRFTIWADVSEDVVRVEFYLDSMLQFNDTDSPFGWSFDTNNYTLGSHTIKAVAYDSFGEEASSETHRNFIPFPTLYVGGILAVIIAVSVIAFICSTRR
jgi:hypothetical protein